MCCIDNSTWRGLAALLILEEGQCEGLTAGMGEKLETPMPFLFPQINIIKECQIGECKGIINLAWIKITLLMRL